MRGPTSIFWANDLTPFSLQAAGIGHNVPIGFGANRVVLVRTAAAKARLPIEFRECLVLTVTESKGLEFNEGPGPPGAGNATSAFSYVNRFSMALLYGRTQGA